MSHRTPSHFLAIDRKVLMAAARSSGANAFSCTTSVHAAKYGSRPLASRAAFLIATATPAGLRRHTPISQTASKPAVAIASHSWSGTLARSTWRPSPLDSACNQGHVLISYTKGCGGGSQLVLARRFA